MEELVTKLYVHIEKAVEADDLSMDELYLIHMLLPKAHSENEMIELMKMFQDKIPPFKSFLKGREEAQTKELSV